MTPGRKRQSWDLNLGMMDSTAWPLMLCCTDITGAQQRLPNPSPRSQTQAEGEERGPQMEIGS